MICLIVGFQGQRIMSWCYFVDLFQLLWLKQNGRLKKQNGRLKNTYDHKIFNIGSIGSNDMSNGRFSGSENHVLMLFC